LRGKKKGEVTEKGAKKLTPKKKERLPGEDK